MTGCSTTLQQVVGNIDKVVHFCTCTLNFILNLYHDLMTTKCSLLILSHIFSSLLSTPVNAHLIHNRHNIISDKTCCSFLMFSNYMTACTYLFTMVFISVHLNSCFFFVFLCTLTQLTLGSIRFKMDIIKTWRFLTQFCVFSNLLHTALLPLCRLSVRFAHG